MKTILCTECKEQIRKKSDLVVAGKLMQPYHNSCLENPSSNIGKLHKFIGKFPVGISFWLLILAGNTFAGEMMRRNPESLSLIILYGIIFNIIFFGGRIGIYLSYEKHLKY